MNNTIRYILFFAAFMLLSVVFTENTEAMDIKTARTSAVLAYNQNQTVAVQDKRAEILEAYLEQYDSPLASYAHVFVSEADKNNLDWKFVASIAGVESWFGQKIPVNSYNGWGWGVYDGNVHNFASWDEAIVTISGALRTNYMDKWGATNVYEVGDIYAADPNWANKVTHFMDEIGEFEKEYETRTLSISI